MDKYLQLLRRKAATGDTEAINAYVHKLEQLLGFVPKTEEKNVVYVVSTYSVYSSEESIILDVTLTEEGAYEAGMDYLESIGFDTGKMTAEEAVDHFNEINEEHSLNIVEVPFGVSTGIDPKIKDEELEDEIIDYELEND